MVRHVKDIRNLGGIKGEEALGISLQCARIRCPQVGRKEDVPVLVEHFRSNVEKVHRAVGLHVVGHRPENGYVPFGNAVTELAHVYPERAVPVRDDVPDLEVSVKAGVRFRYFLQEGQGKPFVFFRCNITPNDMLNAYFLDEEGLDGVSFSEMLPSKTGWNKVFISDEIIRGYQGELQDFVEAIVEDREPECSFDLAAQAIRVIYAAYLSAEIGERVML